MADRDIFVEDLRIGCSCGYPLKENMIHGAKKCRPVDMPVRILETVVPQIVEVSVPVPTWEQFIEVEPPKVRTVPHVRGDVRAVAMRRKSAAVPGQRYIVSYRNEHEKVSVVFEAMLVSRTTNAGKEEVLEFDNGVRITDGLEWFRFQESPDR